MFNPNLTAPLEMGTIAQAGVLDPLANEKGPKGTTRKPWKRQLDLVNTVKTVMQAVRIFYDFVCVFLNIFIGLQ
jgi:hypothetical protein